MTMMRSALLLAFSAFAFVVQAQVAYVLPSPTDANDEITLYIDMNQSQDGLENNALKAILTDHPDEDVYLWTWQPSDPVGGHGTWASSNESMLMTKVSDMLYSISFVPTQFYGIDGSQLFASGISCLAKLKNGNAFDGEYNGEAKSEDFNITVIPRLCDRRLCIFPEVREEDDFLSITYDNNQEELAGLQNIGADECYVYMVARITNFVFYEYVPESQVTSTPELKLEPIPGKPGMFRIIFIPRDFFSMVPPEQKIRDIVFRLVRPGFSYPGVPPQEVISILKCD